MVTATARVAAVVDAYAAIDAVFESGLTELVMQDGAVLFLGWGEVNGGLALTGQAFEIL